MLGLDDERRVESGLGGLQLAALATALTGIGLSSAVIERRRRRALLRCLLGSVVGSREGRRRWRVEHLAASREDRLLVGARRGRERSNSPSRAAVALVRSSNGSVEDLHKQKQKQVESTTTLTYKAPIVAGGYKQKDDDE